MGLLETLNDRIREKPMELDYEDIFPKVRNMGEYRTGGKTNIDLLMAGRCDVHSCCLSSA